MAPLGGGHSETRVACYNQGMTRTTYIEIPAGQEELYYGGLKSGDRYTLPRIVKKTALLGRSKIAKLQEKTYLPIINEAWAGLTEEEKEAWQNCDTHPQQHGWRLFVADMAQRLNLGLPGVATPNQYHQDLVGKIEIGAPASDAKIVQYHPAQYYVEQKVQGKKNMFQPVSVSEILALPLQISICYKSDLAAVGGGAFAKFYAVVRHYFKGQNYDTFLEIDLNLENDWNLVTDTLAVVDGEPVGYTLYIELYNVRGTLLFDNVKAEHSAQNWARDSYCKDISKTFSRAFYQVPENWAAVSMPDGAAYGSIYPL